MDFAVLGPLELRTDAGTQPVTGRRQRALLAALLARPGRTVPLADLIDTLWPQEPPRTAEHTLHTHVSRLRRTLGVPVLTRDGGYLLDVAAEETDAGRFDALMAEATRLPPSGAVVLLERALALWRGPAYGSSADLPAVRPAARRLEERRLLAQEGLVEALGSAGRPAEAVALAENLVGRVPTRETAWVALIHALVAAGRPADGVDAYARAARALDELGLLPSAELRAAHSAALAPPAPPRQPPTPPEPVDATGPAPVVAGPAPVVSRGPGRVGASIPMTGSSLVGREKDIEAVCALLDDAALVTLVGPGGVGKTRLALEVVRRRDDPSSGATRVVELTTLTDPEAVPAAMVAAIGVSADSGPPQAALRRAGEIDRLVLLDNCEHVVDAVAEALEHLLAGGRVRVLTTSRERIGLPGERAHPVTPLPMSGDEPTARELFVQRAAAAGLGQSAHELDPATVDRVVRRLDGLPLAIEMAAARTSTVGLRDLADMLDSELDEEPDLLRNPHRRGPERHRTLRNVIAWSDALLDADEREALHRWPVFVGPVEARDVREVLGVGRQVVESLAQRSLLMAVPDPAGGPTLYRMLHTVRSAVLAAADGVPDSLHRRKATHVAAVATECDRVLRGPDEPRAVARISALIAELRTAHQWARRNDVERAVEISRALQTYAVNTLDMEVLGWGAHLLVEDDDAAAAAGNVALAAQLAITGDLAAANARAALALDLAQDDLTRMQALELLTDTPIYEGRLAEGRERGVEFAALAARVGDPYCFAMAAGSLVLASAYEGDLDRARAELKDFTVRLGQLPSSPSPTALGWMAYAAGEIELDADPATALRSLDRAIELAGLAGNTYLGGVARVSATTVQARHGEPDAALRAFADVIRWWLESGDHPHLITTLRNLLALFLRLGADGPAAELWGTVGSDRTSRSFGVERSRLDEARGALADRLAEEVLAERLAVGGTRDVMAAARAALDTIAALTRG